jgi:DNA-binding winged helix-turn-helix (wHTH) protein
VLGLSAIRLKFADCILDLSARQLERQGKIVSLEPKVYELLETLIKRRPAVVTNQELDELLWPRVYVARTSLTRLVSELRGTLGDVPRASRIIRTAYKTGYAFCAEVTCLASGTNSVARIELTWKKQLLSLGAGEHVAGRDAACELVIDASTVSRRHARIMIGSEVATVEDLNSTNGTRVNGASISGPTPLTPGDELSLGSEVLQVRRRNTSDLTIKMDDRAQTDEKETSK